MSKLAKILTMRSLVLLCVLLSYCTKSQTGILGFASGTTAAAKAYSPIGNLVADNFTGTSLSSGWTANGTPTITVNNNLRVVGSTSTKDMTAAINRTGYGKSTLRNYTVSTYFKINATGSATYGVYAGVESQRNSGIGNQSASQYALFDYVNNALQIVGDTSTRVIKVTSASTSTSGISVNTSDSYQLIYSVNEGTATATIKNLTQSQTVTTLYTYDFTNLYGGAVLRPNIFYYSFGVAGNSDVTFSNVTISSPEYSNPDYLFVGNSITTGYYSGDPQNAYAYKLRANTTKKIQVMAGGGNRSQDVLDNIGEVIARHPLDVVLEIGTNDIGSGVVTTATIESNVSSIISQLTSAGIAVYTTSAPNGGSPSTAGTYNNWLSNNTNFINDYSNYNGTNTVDGIHFNAGGETIEAATIKAALPSLFPN